MNYFQLLKQWFKNKPRSQQLGLAVGLFSLVMMTIGLCFWVIMPDYGILFSQLDSRDAQQIVSQLEQAEIPYQVRNQGSDILIDKALVEKTRIKLMGSGMQWAGNVGFELFDKSDFGMTDFSQKINYQRALQGELERTIISLDEVKSARIHLVIPEQHLFQEDDNLPRAALTLHLQRTLTGQQVRSIQQLVTASVARLPEKNVIIVDQNGNRLTARAGEENSRHFANKKRVEHYLTQKAMHMLKPVFGDAVMVKIDARLNYDKFERELIKPQQQGLVTHEKETRHSTSSKNAKEAAKQDSTREKTYQFGNEKERFIKAPGSIERLTISVLVPKDTDLDQRLQIERLVKSIVGFESKRGDTISIEGLLAHQEPERLASPPLMPNAVSPFQISPTVIVGLLLLVLATGYQYRRMQLKRRQRLLAELTQWLAEHD